MFDRIRNRLNDVLGRARNLQPLAAPVRQAILDANRERALAGVDPTGRRLAPLAPSTLRDRAKKGYPPGPPLVRRGLDSHLIAGCVVQVTTATVGRLSFTKQWPTAPWMEAHQFGGGRLPQRPEFGFSIAELEKIRAMLPRHALGRAGNLG